MNKSLFSQKIKSVFILLSIVIFSFSSNVFATKTVVAYNEANLKADQFWNVRIYTITNEIGTMGGRADSTKFGMRLPADNSIKVSKVRYCIGNLSECMSEENFKNCNMQESDVDINIDVHLLPNNQCHAMRNAG